jgi:hypothetical protein
MTELFFYGWGIITGYVIWAPDTRFKQNFIDGLTFLWRRR